MLRICEFKNSKLNIVKYSWLDRNSRDADMVLTVNDTVMGIISKYNMNKSVFKGNLGRYACTSSLLAGFNGNPFGIDTLAIAKISTAFKEYYKRKGLNFSGWSVHDDHVWYFVISCTSLNDEYAEEGAIKIRYSRRTGRVVMKDFFGNDAATKVCAIVEEYMPKLLKSLQSVSLPIDLFEVCIASDWASEEGYMGSNGNPDYERENASYLLTGELGYAENRTHVLTGVSLVTKNNGFNKNADLEGKYALLIVQ